MLPGSGRAFLTTDDEGWADEWAEICEDDLERRPACPRCGARYGELETVCHPPDPDIRVIGYMDRYCDEAGLNINSYGEIVDK